MFLCLASLDVYWIQLACRILSRFASIWAKFQRPVNLVSFSSVTVSIGKMRCYLGGAASKSYTKIVHEVLSLDGGFVLAEKII